MNRIVVAIGSYLLYTNILNAQVQPAPPPEASVSTLPRRFLNDELRMWSSPFRRSSYDSRAVKKFVIPFALISTALIASDRKIAGAFQTHPLKRSGAAGSRSLVPGTAWPG